jgi:hypothetical protein
LSFVGGKDHVSANPRAGYVPERTNLLKLICPAVVVVVVVPADADGVVDGWDGDVDGCFGDTLCAGGVESTSIAADVGRMDPSRLFWC